MYFEYNSLFQNQTWILVPCPLDQSIIGCKWVCKHKCKIDGTLDRCKDYTQVERIDYNDTLSHVLKIILL
jgi:hypothetical protein